MPAKDALGSGRKLTQINVKAIHGEPGTGYEAPGDLGEFECGNCRYFDSKVSACSQRDMKKLSKQPRLKDGRVKVDSEACCEYVERIGVEREEPEHK